MNLFVCLLSIVSDSNPGVWICVTNVFQESIVLFADERFAMMAGNI